jgi:hypothetical protein
MSENTIARLLYLYKPKERDFDKRMEGRIIILVTGTGQELNP